jgi:hypothetical protein
MFVPIPWTAVAAATVVVFLFGAVWYGVFGERWLAAMGKRKEDLNSKDITPYLTAAVSSFVSAIAVALVVGWVAPTIETRLMTAFFVGVLLGGAVAAASLAKHYAFAGKSWDLLLIDAGHDFVGFILMSFVVVMMR